MKKLLATLLASAMALTAMGGLVACGEKEPDPVAATGIKLNLEQISDAPDSQWGITATLTPANTTSKVEWKVANDKLASVSAGGANNKMALVTLLDSGETKVTATVDGKSAECTITVGEWQRFMLVGTNNGWDPSDASEEWLFTQDATDKHLWTIEVELAASSMVKIVAAARVTDEADPNYGKIVGRGWLDDFNFGINSDNPDTTGAKKQNIVGDEGELNVHSAGSSGNITIGSEDDGGKEGKYKLTLKTTQGGGFGSLTYKYLGAAE